MFNSTGDEGLYYGVLAKDGQQTTLDFRISKGCVLWNTGDCGSNRGTTKWI